MKYGGLCNKLFIAFPPDIDSSIVGVGLAPTRYNAGNRKGCPYIIMPNVKGKCYKESQFTEYFHLKNIRRKYNSNFDF